MKLFIERMIVCLDFSGVAANSAGGGRPADGRAASRKPNNTTMTIHVHDADADAEADIMD